MKTDKQQAVEIAANAFKAKRHDDMLIERDNALKDCAELKNILFEQTKEIKQHQKKIKYFEGLIKELREDIDKKNKAIAVFIDSLEND